MIEDTRQQLREARLRLKESREALAADARPLERGGAAPLDRPENFWGTPEPAEEPPAERYVPSTPEWAQRFLARLPVWARPAVLGAAAGMVLASIRVLDALPRILREPRHLLEAAGVMLLVAAMGAVGGVAFSLVRPKLKPLGWIGDVATGVVCVTAYMCTLFVVAPLLFGEQGPVVRDAEGAVAFAGFCLFFGTIVGLSWFDAARRRDADSR